MCEKSMATMYLGKTWALLISAFLAMHAMGCSTSEESTSLTNVLSALSDSESAVPDACDIVVATNGSDSNPGTESLPVLSPHKAASMVIPGQTICLRAGVYATKPASGALGSGPIKLDTVASAHAHIVFRSYPGEIAVLDGSQGGQDDDLLQVRGQYIDIVALELRNAKNFAINLDKWDGTSGQHIRILRNAIHDSFKGAVYPGTNSEDMRFESNIVFHNVRSNQNAATALPQSGWPAAVILTKSGDVIEGNLIFRNWGKGLGIYGTGHHVANNKLHDNFDVNLYVSTAENVHVERNSVYSPDVEQPQR